MAVCEVVRGETVVKLELTEEEAGLVKHLLAGASQPSNRVDKCSLPKLSDIAHNMWAMMNDLDIEVTSAPFRVEIR